MEPFTKAVASLPGCERIARHRHGGQVFIHATGRETGGAFGIWETFSAPGTGPAAHVHTRETEIFRVISGTFRFWCGVEVFDAGVGGVVVLPPHIPHAWRNIGGDPGRMMGVVTPGGFEHFFLELQKADARTPGEIAEIQERHGVFDVDMDIDTTP
jgi:mannose-6-phosphate isomerase-like protein (cupin superfamily)